MVESKLRWDTLIIQTPMFETTNKSQKILSPCPASSLKIGLGWFLTTFEQSEISEGSDRHSNYFIESNFERFSRQRPS